MTKKYKFIKTERKHQLECKELENDLNILFEPFKKKHYLVVDLKEFKMNQKSKEGNSYHEIILRFKRLPSGRGNNVRLYFYMKDNKVVEKVKIRMRDTTNDYIDLLNKSLNQNSNIIDNTIVGSIIEIEK